MRKAPKYPTHKADALANFRKERRAHHENHPWPKVIDALVDAGFSPRMLREAMQRGGVLKSPIRAASGAEVVPMVVPRKDEAPET